ncbi:MAG: glycoside hydrolase family 57 protein [Candidatus Hydrothermarchaeales archaeon]
MLKVTDICLGFEAHQPMRLSRGFNRDFAEGKSMDELFDVYFNNTWNRTILKRVAEKCYFPANDLMLENIDRHKGGKKEFKVSYSISGLLIDQFEAWFPDLLESFKQLAETGRVEFLDQTYYHSLVSLFPDRGEFIDQIEMHRRAMKDLLGYSPMAFENTEFIFNNSIAKVVESLGYKAIFTEGIERVLGWRSPNYVYRSKDGDLRILLRNYRMTDDVGFRFSARWWSEFPLTAEKYSSWLAAMQGDCINIFLDYETIGEHQWAETGIFEFFSWLPGEVLKYEHLNFATPSELVDRYGPKDEIDVDDFDTISWADIERDTGAWLSNDMQRTCYDAIRRLEPFVKETNDETTLKIWRNLQISDHLYYMFIAGGGPGIVHGYFSQQTPIEVFHAFTAILSDFQERVSEQLPAPEKTSALLLRVLPPERAMHYHEDGDYIGISAHSLGEFKETIPLVSPKAIKFHLMSDHFENWIRFTIGDGKLADEVRGLKEGSFGPTEAQRLLWDLVKKRYDELSNALPHTF